MTKPKALALVKELTSDSGNVLFTDHALRRMRKRKVTPKAVLKCLRRGVIAEGPAQSLKGTWELALERMDAGRRLRVACALGLPGRIVVITVYEVGE